MAKKTVNVVRNFVAGNVVERMTFTESQLKRFTFEPAIKLNAEYTYVLPYQYIHKKIMYIAGREISSARVYIFGIDANGIIRECFDVPLSMFTSQHYGIASLDAPVPRLSAIQKDGRFIPAPGTQVYSAIDRPLSYHVDGTEVAIKTSIAFKVDNNATKVYTATMESHDGSWGFGVIADPDSLGYLLKLNERNVYLMRAVPEVPVIDFSDFPEIESVQAGL